MVSFIWSVADLLRGDYKASDYGKVILPFTVLRRLDCLLEPTKKAVLAQAAKLPAKADSAMREMLLNRAAGLAEKGCEVVVAPTPDAIHAFNKAHGKKLGLFHVTC